VVYEKEGQPSKCSATSTRNSDRTSRRRTWRGPPGGSSERAGLTDELVRFQHRRSQRNAISRLGGESTALARYFSPERCHGLRGDRGQTNRRKTGQESTGSGRCTRGRRPRRPGGPPGPGTAGPGRGPGSSRSPPSACPRQTPYHTSPAGAGDAASKGKRVQGWKGVAADQGLGSASVGPQGVGRQHLDFVGPPMTVISDHQRWAGALISP
jgi:hypothetical protein